MCRDESSTWPKEKWKSTVRILYIIENTEIECCFNNNNYILVIMLLQCPSHENCGIKMIFEEKKRETYGIGLDSSNNDLQEHSVLTDH